MNVERWNQVKEILEIVLDKDANSLEEYLNKVCNEDPELRAEVLEFISKRELGNFFSRNKAIDLLDESSTKTPKSEDSNGSKKKAKISFNVSENIVGRVLGDFLIKEKLGEGGFGTVYKATQISLSREAAIKILHTRHRTNQNIIERFKREAHLASRLEHPYCAHIYSFGAERDGLLWIAMEFVQGTPLNEILRSRTALPLEKFVPLLDKICEVVHTAHETGIVHRDLKPANVMVISRAGRLLPKLLDFGIAKGLNLNSPIANDFLLGETNEETDSRSLSDKTSKDNIKFTKDFIINPKSTINNKISTIESQINHSNNDRLNTEKKTNSNNQEIALKNPNYISRNNEPFQTEGFIGSPAYMSPEQWESGANVDARSDIYSLGVLAYQVITGTLPFKEKGIELYKAHTSKNIPPLKESFPAKLNQVLQKALAKKAEDRYQTVLEFAKDFRLASNFDEDKALLPNLDEFLKEDLLINAPKPLAESISSLLASHNIYQFRDRVFLVFQVFIRYIGILALVNYISFSGKKEKDDLVSKYVKSLCQEGLSKIQWIELSRELCRPFAKNKDIFPIPELVSLFFVEDGENLNSTNETFTKLLLLEEKVLSNTTLKEEELVKLLADFLGKLTLLLKAALWLNDYHLVIPEGNQATKWMGATKKLAIVAIKNNKLANGKPILIDSSGCFVLSLWPLIEVTEPIAGTEQEIFLLEGKGHNGAKLISFPQRFEIENEETLEWLRNNFFAENEKSHIEYLIEKSPYLGLATFSPEDNGLFFGREKETESFLNRLQIQPLLVVVGASGAGKSSFIQAGVVAALGQNWQVITTRPGISPLTTLSLKLSTLGIELVDLKLSLQKNVGFLAQILRDFTIKTKNKLLLVVDQFEEILTLCSNKEEQTLYVEAIVSAACSEEDSIRVILTLRDDFLVQAKELSGLKERLNQALEILTIPDSAQLLRILILPARKAGYEFEDNKLPIEIMEELKGQPSALPLLAFTAAKLWEQRDKQFKLLRRRSYELMGGVGGALAKHAESMLQQMTQAEQILVREAFRHLVTSYGTRSILTRSELLQLLGNTKNGESIIEKLILSRLLVSTEGEKGIDRIEIVHEALLSTWPRLIKWQREDAEGARLRDQLRETARQWQERNRPKGLLWRDDALAELQLWRSRYAGKLTDIEEAFSNASLAEAARSRLRRRFLLTAAFGVLIAALTVFYWINKQTEAQLLNSYEEQGRQELLNGKPGRAAVYFSEAYKRGKNTAGLKLMMAETVRLLENSKAYTLEGHQSGVNFAVFSPDASKIVSGDDSFVVKVWETSTGRLIKTITDHTDEVLGVAFSPDGKFFATTGRDKTIKFWDSSSYQLIKTLQGLNAAIRKISFSHDGKKIVSSSEDNALTIWDVEKGQILESFKYPFRVSYSVFSPDDKTVLMANGDNQARILDLQSKNITVTFEGHKDRVQVANFSPDGKKVVTASTDGLAKIWDATTGKLLLNLVGHNNGVNSASFNSTGTLVVTGSGDSSIKIWNAEDGLLISSLEGHTSYVWSTFFNDKGDKIVSAGYDSKVKIWDISKLQLLGSVLETFPNKLTSAEFSHDGKQIVTVREGKKLSLWDVETKKQLFSFDVNTTTFISGFARFSPDDSKILTTAAGDPKFVLGNPLGMTRSKVANIWDKTGKLLLTLKGHEGDIWYAAYSADGKRIITGSADKTAKIWDAETGKLLLTLEGHKNQVNCVEFSSDGKLAVTVSGFEKTIIIWDAYKGTILQTIRPHDLEILQAHFSPDGKRIISSSKDTSVKVWDLVNNKLLFSLEGAKADIFSCDYSNDGDFIAATSTDGTLRIWDAYTGKQVMVIQAHKEWGIAVRFSSNSRKLVTASLDGTIKIWSIKLEERTPEEFSKFVQTQVPLRFEQGNLVSAKAD